MPNATTGVVIPYDFNTVAVVDGFFRQLFVNEFPALSRLNRVQGKGASFDIYSWDRRPRAVTYSSGAGAGTPAADTVETWTVDDTTAVLEGDVFIVAGAEYVQVEQVLTSTTMKVRRGQSSSSVTTQASVTGSLVLVGNSRRGNEVDQPSYLVPSTKATQYHQRGIYPVQIGGRAMDVQNIVAPRVLPGGGAYGFENLGSDPLNEERGRKLIDLYTDFEYTLFYGKGQADAGQAGKRALMNGFKNLIKSGNVKTNGGASYTFNSLVADLLQKSFDNGGAIDLAFCSPGFLTGLHTWGFGKILTDTETTDLGVPIRRIVLPLSTGAVTLIPHPLLGGSNDHTIVGFTKSEVGISVLRPETWTPRGNRGDAVEGDWKADLAAWLVNPGHHAWVSGITSFA